MRTQSAQFDLGGNGVALLLSQPALTFDETLNVAANMRMQSIPRAANGEPIAGRQARFNDASNPRQLIHD